MIFAQNIILNKSHFKFVFFQNGYGNILHDRINEQVRISEIRRIYKKFNNLRKIIY